MALYEHIFMVRQDASTTQVEALTQQFKTVLEENGASISKTEYWGVKTLQFRIKKNRKAHFTLMNIDGAAVAVDEMERQMSINDDVIRFLKIRVDEHEEGPSVMMRAGRGRDERGPRGGGGFRDRDDRPRRDGDRPRRDQDAAPSGDSNAPAADAQKQSKGDE